MFLRLAVALIISLIAEVKGEPGPFVGHLRGPSLGLLTAYAAELKPKTGPEKEAGQTLRVVIDAEPAHLNPILDPDLWGYRIAHDLLCEPLLRRRAEAAKKDSTEEPREERLEDRGGPRTDDRLRETSDQAAIHAREESPPSARYEPVLAERFRLDSDGRGIELFLRRGVRFHDGRLLTAHDVRATLEMVRAAGGKAVPPAKPQAKHPPKHPANLGAAISVPSGPTAATAVLLSDILRIQVLGPEHIRIDLRRATHRAAILSALSEIDIVPSTHFPGGHLVHQPWNRRPVCTGPYRFVEWRRGSHIVLRKNPSYWGPPPALEELRFRIALDGAQGLSLLRQGEADVLGRVMPRYLADQVEPAVQRGRFRKVELDANQVVVLLPNGRHPELEKAELRQTLSQLLDREKLRDRLVRDVRKGLGTPIRLPALRPELFGALALAAKESALSAPPSPLPPKDAAQVMPPVHLHVLIPSGASELQEVARRLGEACQKASIKLENELVDLPTFTSRLRHGAFELALFAWSWTGEDEDLNLEPLLDLARIPGAAHEKSLLARWEAEAPLFLLYRPRQVVLLSPQVEPAQPEPLGDFIRLRTLTKKPPRSYNTAMR